MLGLLLYGLSQATVFLGLYRLPAVTVGLLLGLTPAVVNTAVAFTVWNYTVRRLSAMESSLINNTMLVHVAVLAWIFLGERPNPRSILGLVLVAGGVVLVHLRRVGNRQITSQTRH